MEKLSLTLIFLCTSGAGAQSLSPGPTPKPLTVEFQRIASETAEAASLIKLNHIAGNHITYERLTTESMYFMLHTLDPHSDYMDIEAAEDFKRRINAQYFGVGMLISEMLDAGGNVRGSFVREVFKGSPAHNAGLRFGDEIVEVGGVSVKGKGFDDVRPRLLGPLGTKVVVVVDRQGERISKEFVRAAIPTPAIIDAYMIRPGVGYVAMNNTMTHTAHEEFRAALARLRTSGLTSLILDVRNNTGGAAREACRIVSEFIPRGEVIYDFKGRAVQGPSGCVSQNDSPDLMTPLVVLIDRNSASAAEFLAAGFQDTDRAILVGEATFGKGLAQNVMELEGGRRIHLTTSRLVTHTGRMIQRDYSGGLYRYYFGGTLPAPARDMPAFRTRTGRVLYGGVGVVPDEAVKPGAADAVVGPLLNRLRGPVFAFTREIVTGRVPMFQTYKLDRPADLGYELRGNEFPVTAELFAAFKTFAVETFKMDPAGIQRDRPLIEGLLRTELIVAAYSSRAAQRLTNESDPQLRRAIESLPQANELLKSSLSARKKL